MNPDLTLTPKQSNIFVKGWLPETRFRTAVCGRRFGKTFLAAAEVIRAIHEADARQIPIENEIWYGAPTFKQAKRVFWARLKKSIPRDWMVTKPNESNASITLNCGRVIRIVGLDTHDSLRGSGLWFFVGDEWADCKPEAWEETIRPMLSSCGGHALFIGTPKGFNHFYEGFVKGQNSKDHPDHKSWSYTTLQGGNVPQQEITAARASLDTRVFRQEYEASFETYAGRVYYAFARAENVRPCPLNDGLPLHIGMDFNINPMSAAVWQIQPDGELWQVDEIVIPTSNTDEMCREITTRYGKRGFDPNAKLSVDHITIYPDPAGAQRRTSAQGRTDISILRDHGFTVLAMSTHPLVRDRINLVNAKFQTADGTRHAYVDTKCHASIKAYERLIYKDGTNNPDKTLGLDHLADATGYFLFGRFAYKPVQSQVSGHLVR